MATSSSDASSSLATTSASAAHRQVEGKGGFLVGMVQELGMLVGSDSRASLKDGKIVTDKEENSVDAELEAKRIYTSDQFVLAGSGPVDFVREVAGTLGRMSVNGDGDNLVNVSALGLKVEEQLKDAVLKGMDDNVEFLLVGWDDDEVVPKLSMRHIDCKGATIVKSIKIVGPLDAEERVNLERSHNQNESPKEASDTICTIIHEASKKCASVGGKVKVCFASISGDPSELKLNIEMWDHAAFRNKFHLKLTESDLKKGITLPSAELESIVFPSWSRDIVEKFESQHKYQHNIHVRFACGDDHNNVPIASEDDNTELVFCHMQLSISKRKDSYLLGDITGGDRRKYKKLVEKLQLKVGDTVGMSWDVAGGFLLASYHRASA